MQQQPRRSFGEPLVPAQPECRQTVQDDLSGPVELDLDALEHVAGGDQGDTPKKYW